jgi:hypothetical protein
VPPDGERGLEVAAVALTSHRAEPKPGTLYSVEGINTGLEANPDYPTHYPMEAFCSCGEIVRRVWYPEFGHAGFWTHTGRMPGG